MWDERILFHSSIFELLTMLVILLTRAGRRAVRVIFTTVVCFRLRAMASSKASISLLAFLIS